LYLLFRADTVFIPHCDSDDDSGEGEGELPNVALV